MPTVTVVTDVFRDLGLEVASTLGCPGLRFSVIQHPLGGLGREEVERRAREAARDIIGRLSESMPAAQEQTEGAIPGELEIRGSWDEVDAYFYSRGWTDGLPIVPPEAGRVERMIAAVPLPPQDIVGIVAPRMGVATIEKIAVNAVMAGCAPEYFPVLVAAVKAVCHPDFNLLPMQATTNPVTPMIIVNGPVAKTLGINAGDNVFGQGSRANMAIGRALRLVLTNIGGGVPGKADKACHGQPGKLSFCIAENEEASPWEPLHVERGFNAGESAVSAIGVTGTQDIIHYARTSPAKLLDTLVHAIPRDGFKNLYSGGEPLFVLGPEQAAILAAGGLSKKDVKRIIFERARVPAGLLTAETLELVKGRRPELVADGRELTEIPIASREDDILVAVAGGAGNHTVFLPTWGDTRCVTVPVEQA